MLGCYCADVQKSQQQSLCAVLKDEPRTEAAQLKAQPADDSKPYESQDEKLQSLKPSLFLGNNQDLKATPVWWGEKDGKSAIQHLQNITVCTNSLG